MPKVLRSSDSEDGTYRPTVVQEKETDPRDLNEIASEVGHAHARQAEAKTSLEKGRKAFFKKLTAKHRAAPRAKKTVLVDGTDFLKGEAHIAQYHPGWLIIDQRTVRGPEGEKIRYILEEDPEYIGDQIITGRPDLPGFVVTRTIRSGTTLIDLDRMKDDDPELYEQVTFVPEPEREPKAESDLTPEQLNAIKPYIYEDKRTAALNVRKAKPEDYEAS